jgi:hypothetical protein
MLLKILATNYIRNFINNFENKTFFLGKIIFFSIFEIVAEISDGICYQNFWQHDGDL